MIISISNISDLLNIHKQIETLSSEPTINNITISLSHCLLI